MQRLYYQHLELDSTFTDASAQLASGYWAWSTWAESFAARDSFLIKASEMAQYTLKIDSQLACEYIRYNYIVITDRKGTLTRISYTEARHSDESLPSYHIFD